MDGRYCPRQGPIVNVGGGRGMMVATQRGLDGLGDINQFL